MRRVAVVVLALGFVAVSCGGASERVGTLPGAQSSQLDLELESEDSTPPLPSTTIVTDDGASASPDGSEVPKPETPIPEVSKVVVAMPTLVGLANHQTAAAVLGAIGCPAPSAQLATNTLVAAGSVIEQTPPPGTPLVVESNACRSSDGFTPRVVIASPSESPIATMPNLVGYPDATSASKALAATCGNGKLTTIAVVDDSVQSGTIVSQSPEPGTPITLGELSCVWVEGEDIESPLAVSFATASQDSND